MSSRTRSSFLLRVTRPLRHSWTSWLLRSRERKVVRLDRAMELHLLQAEQLRLRASLARVKLLPLEAQQLQLLRIREQQRHPLQAAPQLPLPEPPSPAQMGQVWQLTDPREEEPMPSAEDQLGSLLVGPLTPPTSTQPSPT